MLGVEDMGKVRKCAGCVNSEERYQFQSRGIALMTEYLHYLIQPV